MIGASAGGRKGCQNQSSSGDNVWDEPSLPLVVGHTRQTTSPPRSRHKKPNVSVIVKCIPDHEELGGAAIPACSAATLGASVSALEKTGMYAPGGKSRRIKLS